jgi:RHS repeat-associated protein
MTRLAATHPLIPAPGLWLTSLLFAMLHCFLTQSAYATDTTPAVTRNLAYDNRGNLATETRGPAVTATTAYDGHGRLISYARTGEDSFANSYNGLGDRVSTARTPVGGGSADVRTFVTAPDGRTMGEYGNRASDVRAEFIWMSPEVGDAGSFGGDDGLGGYMPLAIALPTATAGVTQLRWVHGDHMGTPIVMTDASGAAVPQPSGYYATAFPGQSKTLHDLYYNRYRDYDPTTGRYIQADPIGLAGGANPYSYAMNNPVRYTDPTGEFVPLLVVGGRLALQCGLNPAAPARQARSIRGADFARPRCIEVAAPAPFL